MTTHTSAFNPLRIEEARIAAGLSREEVAARTGRSYGLITQVEKGIKPPSLSVLVSIANTLGVPVAEFFTVGDDE